MLYLSGHTRPDLHPLMGYMRTPGGGTPLYDRPWAADNGQFSGRVSLEQWQAWLDNEPRENCLFAAVPDVVADADKTLQMARTWLPVVANLGFPPAFVAQDGWHPDKTPWNDIAAIFIGGSTEWKLTAGHHVAREGRRRGKHVHMGRVNTRQRLKLAQAIGCHTVDGTKLCFGFDINNEELTRWLTELKNQPQLALETT